MATNEDRLKKLSERFSNEPEQFCPEQKSASTPAQERGSTSPS